MSKGGVVENPQLQCHAAHAGMSYCELALTEATLARFQSGDVGRRARSSLGTHHLRQRLGLFHQQPLVVLCRLGSSSFCSFRLLPLPVCKTGLFTFKMDTALKSST